ncbi:MAG TPA: hypothetical protein VE287_12565 [Actinopolymorphaceae bacterium]|jgi:hypothetical protein|nr:hypothetical protein [Actinopolymorphaceae bacterium]
MTEPYTYDVATSDGDGGWILELSKDVRSALDRDAEAIARAILEDWIIDHPLALTGGQRLEVFGNNPSDYPPDELVSMRVWVYPGQREAHDPSPAAAAYLVAEPDDSSAGVAG